MDPSALKALDGIAEKQSVQNIVAAELVADENLAQLTHINELFEHLDQNGDGTVTEAEARLAMRQSGISPQQVERIIKAVLNREGKVQYTGFMAKLLLAQR